MMSWIHCQIKAEREEDPIYMAQKRRQLDSYSRNICKCREDGRALCLWIEPLKLQVVTHLWSSVNWDNSCPFFTSLQSTRSIKEKQLLAETCSPILWYSKSLTLWEVHIKIKLTRTILNCFIVSWFALEIRWRLLLEAYSSFLILAFSSSTIIVT